MSLRTAYIVVSGTSCLGGGSKALKGAHGDKPLPLGRLENLLGNAAATAHRVFTERLFVNQPQPPFVSLARRNIVNRLVLAKIFQQVAASVTVDSRGRRFHICPAGNVRVDERPERQEPNGLNFVQTRVRQIVDVAVGGLGDIIGYVFERRLKTSQCLRHRDALSG